MHARRLKTGYFVLEGLNSFATVYYLYYFYFFMQQQFGFGNKANLLLAALNGATYAIGCFFAGKLAQHGYFRALKVGFITMAGAMVAGLFCRTAAGQIMVMVFAVLGMCFTWPTLEALVSGGESRTGVQHMVGVYNVVWAATAALGNFTGGAMLAHLGLASLFWVPLASFLGQIGLTYWLERQARTLGLAEALHENTRSGISALDPSPIESSAPHAARLTNRTVTAFSPRPSPPAEERKKTVEAAGSRSPSMRECKARVHASHSVRLTLHSSPPPMAGAFLKMAWLANPFAYIGINTLIAVMPGIALRLGLSTTLAGFCCSVWCFSRFGAFVVFWLWSGWHYRFRWLLLSYLCLVVSFISVLLTPSVAVLVIAQLFFGAATGLIYYSSLFYSMDLGDASSEHGGFHEAAIGLGNLAGPTVGAAALQFVPQYSSSGAVAVTLLLLGGLGGLATIWRRGKTAAVRAISATVGGPTPKIPPPGGYAAPMPATTSASPPRPP